MIGKIYRPIKITTLLDKRGLRFMHKYKSNFAGFHEFQKDVYLHFQDGGESIRIEFVDLKVPVLLKKSEFHLVTEKHAVSNNPKKEILLDHLTSFSMLRKLARPKNKQMSSVKGVLTVEMSISSDQSGNDEVLRLKLKPVVINNEEYLSLETEKCKTQIEVLTNSSVCLND